MWTEHNAGIVSAVEFDNKIFKILISLFWQLLLLVGNENKNKKGKF